ncbi:MAG: aldo/keto reductase [Planctomycetota bacterium]|nr:MAG: aldo/keto reductase [Planctomycetota bacterium]
MEYRPLGQTGALVSALGFGAAPLGDVYGPLDQATATKTVHLALDHGINYFDVAPYYGLGLAEERLGVALRGIRNQVFLATKCGRLGVNEFDFSAAGIQTSLEASLRRLQTDTVDLLQIHDVEFGDPNQIVEETMPALQRFKKEGKIRFTGLTGLPLGYLKDLARRTHPDTLLSYAHYNLMVDDLVEVLGSFSQEKGIALINASPLHLGILTDQGPQTWHAAPAVIQEKGRELGALCRRRGRPISEVALRFALDLNDVATTLVGMGRPNEVEANLQVLEAASDFELLEELAALVAPVKNRIWTQGKPENNY